MKKRPFLVSFALLLASISPSVMVNANIASARDLGNHGTKSGNEVKSVAQSKKITGTVVDAAGVPIIGANVIVVGTTNGSITDMDGKFVIEDVAEGAKLKVSYIGYIDQVITVSKQADYSISMKEDSQNLDEVVVVGYGVQKKVNMTGSISNVKSDELTAIPNTNLSNSLAGRAPGATIVGNSGLMGSSSEIRMRGGFADPLFVIDGIIRDKEAFDALEPYEID